MSNVPVQLIQVLASDGVRLDGVLHMPDGDAGTTRTTLDAVVCLHGAASNFYSSTVIEAVTQPLLDLGIAVLRVNTRGHDGICTLITEQGRRRGGAAYENVSDCCYDITGSVNFLVQQGFAQVGLFGHSLGAIKAVYSQAKQPHDAVRAIVAVSPPRLSYSAFRNGEQSVEFFETMATAQKHVQTGQGDVLMTVRYPVPLVITADGYVDKYGLREDYNILNFADHVRCPTLFIYGGMELDEGGIAFAGLPEAIRRLAAAGAPLKVTTVPDADHFYTGDEQQMAAETTGWISSLKNVKT